MSWMTPCFSNSFSTPLLLLLLPSSPSPPHSPFFSSLSLLSLPSPPPFSLLYQVASQELIQAAAEGDIATVTTLLKTGAVHVNVVDRNGHSALFAAAVNLS